MAINQRWWHEVVKVTNHIEPQDKTSGGDAAAVCATRPHRYLHIKNFAPRFWKPNEAARSREKGNKKLHATRMQGAVWYIKFLKTRRPLQAAVVPAGYGDPDEAFHSKCVADTSLPQGTPPVWAPLLRRTSAAERLRRLLPVQLPELIPATWTASRVKHKDRQLCRTATPPRDGRRGGMWRLGFKGLRGADFNADKP